MDAGSVATRRRHGWHGAWSRLRNRAIARAPQRPAAALPPAQRVTTLRRMSDGFGDLLTALVARRGLTMAAFAARGGASASTLSRIRRGDRAPTAPQAARWADALGLQGGEREEFLASAALAQAPAAVRARVAAAEAQAREAESQRSRLADGLGRLRADSGFHDGWWLTYSRAFLGDGRIQRSLLRLRHGQAELQVRDTGLLRYRYHGVCEALGDKLFIRLAEDRGGIEYVQITLHTLFDLSRPAFLFGLVSGISGTDRRHPLSWPTAARILLLHCGTEDAFADGSEQLAKLEQCLGLYDPATLRSAWPAFLGDDDHLRPALGLTDDEPLARAVLRLIDNRVDPADGVLRAALAP